MKPVRVLKTDPAAEDQAGTAAVQVDMAADPADMEVEIAVAEIGVKDSNLPLRFMLLE